MKDFFTDLGHVGLGLLIIIAIMGVGYVVFSKLTRFDDGAEIGKGNEAAGIYMGSKLLGLSIIVGMVSYSSESWTSMIAWSGVGIVILVLIYLLLEFITPKLNIGDEIGKGNTAVARLLQSIIIGVSIVVGTILM